MCRKIIGIAAIAIAVLTATQTVWAADGVWSSTAATGTWNTTTNWHLSAVATGAGSTADFNQIDVPVSGIDVSVDGSPTLVGNLIFGDTNTSTAGGWLLTDGGSGYLYMEAGTGAVPSITVNALGGTSVAEIRIPLYCSLAQGINKLGSGTLVLSTAGSPITGGVTVSAGTLRLTGGDNMLNTLDTTSTITVNGTLDLGGFSQTCSAVTTTATPPVTTSGIILNGNVQNGTLVNTGKDPTTYLGLNYDARSGNISANLTQDLVSGPVVGLTKTTGGTMTLSGVNTYTGGTVLNEGTLIFDTLSSIPTTGNITANSGMLRFNSSSLPLPSGSITLNASSALAVTGPYSTSNTWMSSGKIVNTAAGALALVQDEGSINMASGSGYANMSLGAYGTVTFTGTLTPMNNTYRLGGAGTLIMPITNALTNNGATPRSLVISGPGTVELSNNNNFSGGTTLSGGVLRIGNVNSIGGPTSTLTFNGGQLEINNSGLSIDSNNVNWSTFNGGFIVDPGVTFTVNRNVTGGTRLSKGGLGTLNIAGNYQISQGVNLDYGTTIIAAGATLDATLGFDIINGGGRGHAIISQPGSNLATTMRVSGGVDAEYTGYMKLGGGDGTVAVLDIYGNNTTLQTTVGQNMISMSEWGSATSTINVHDSALLQTGFLCMANWGGSKATVNLYDNAQAQTSAVFMGNAGNGGGTLNMYNNSHLTVAGPYTYTNGGTSTLYTGALVIERSGNMPSSTLNIGDTATIDAGEIRIAEDAWWATGAGIMNVTGNSRVNTNTNNGASGNLYVGYGGNGQGYLNIKDTAVVTVANSVILSFQGNAFSQLNVSGSGKLTAAQIDLSSATGGGNGRRMNIFQNAQVKTTGNLLHGAAGGTNGMLNGTINVSDSGYLEVGGNYNLNFGPLTISSTTGTPQVKVLGDFTLGSTGAGATSVSINGNGALIIGNTVAGTGNLSLVNGTLNTSAVSTAAGTDGRVQLIGANSDIIFNGGTISPTASNATFLQGLAGAYVNIGAGSGGAIFNTAGFDITVAQNLLTDPALSGGMDGGLNKQGNGTLTLTGNNTYIGGTVINGGSLNFASANSLPTTGNITVNNGGVLRFTTPVVPTAGSITINAGGALEANASDAYNTVTAWLGSGKIASSSNGAIAISADSSESINMSAYSTLSLGATGSRTYAGTLTPSGSTYQLGGGGGTLYLSDTNAITGAGRILAVNGPGTVVLQGNNDYSGGTSLNGGTLSYTNDASIGGASSAINFNGGLLMVPVATANDLGSHVVNWTTFNGGFDVTTGDTFTVTQSISGTGSLTKGGAGTLVLTGQSSYSGGTNIYFGTLRLSGGADRLPTTSAITVTGGGTLDLGANTQNTTGNITFAGGTVQNGTLTNTGTSYYGQSGAVSAILGGTVGLTKSTTGTLSLSGANTYSGGTIINAGMLQLTLGSNRLLSSGAITITGGVLNLDGNSQAAGAAAVIIQGGTVENGTLTKTRGVYDAQSGTVSANINKTGAFTVSLTKSTTGTLTFSGTSNYNSTTTIKGGTLQLTGGNDRLPTVSSTVYPSIVVTANWLTGDPAPLTRGTLDLGGYTQHTNSFVQFLEGTVQNGTLISSSATPYDAQAGNISAILGGSAGLNKTGVGIITLSGANTYTGVTTIGAGTLQLTGGNDRLATTGAITITGGVLDLFGNSQTTSGAVSIQGGLIDNGTIIKSGAAYDGQSGTVTANLQGTAALIKTTANLLTLVGANTYSGGTTISAGTLQINGGNDRLANNGSITITGGILDFGLNSQTTSAAVSFQGGRVQNGTIIKSGAAYDGQAGTVSAILQGSAGLTKTTGGVLTLTGALNYTGLTDIQAGTLQINNGLSTTLAAITGTSAGTLGIGNNSSLTANSVNVGTVTLGVGTRLTIAPIPGGPTAGGTLTAVPEPSTLVLLAIAALGLIGTAVWRRQK